MELGEPKPAGPPLNMGDGSGRLTGAQPPELALPKFAPMAGAGAAVAGNAAAARTAATWGACSTPKLARRKVELHISSRDI